MIEIEREMRLAKSSVSQQRFLCRKIAPQATRIREEKSVTTKEFPVATKEFFVATKEFPITTEIAKDSKKSCRDRVDMLKRKMFFATRKIVSRQIPDAKGHEKLVANRFGVATQNIPIATRTGLLH